MLIENERERARGGERGREREGGREGGQGIKKVLGWRMVLIDREREREEKEEGG